MDIAWIEQAEQRASREALFEAISICTDASITFLTRTERGPVAAVLDRVAHDEHATQIVMGTRGHGGVPGLLLGSVAIQLLQLTDIPLTLVK